MGIPCTSQPLPSRCHDRLPRARRAETRRPSHPHATSIQLQQVLERAHVSSLARLLVTFCSAVCPAAIAWLLRLLRADAALWTTAASRSGGKRAVLTHDRESTVSVTVSVPQVATVIGPGALDGHRPQKWIGAEAASDPAGWHGPALSTCTRLLARTWRAAECSLSAPDTA